MTTERLEVIIEGSADGITWLPYEFKYKPGNMRTPCAFIYFHMPRVDWRAWFLAFGRPPAWFDALLYRLWQAQPEVLKLLKHCPFPAGHEPQYLRALLYDYKFSSNGHWRTTGEWWTREFRVCVLHDLIMMAMQGEFRPAFRCNHQLHWLLQDAKENLRGVRPTMQQTGIRRRSFPSRASDQAVEGVTERGETAR